MKTNSITVWDPVVRGFHWILVAAFFTAYITEDDAMSVHVFAGYTIIALLLIRIAWGLVGTRYARFSNFIYSPRTAINYLKDVFKFKAKRYIGHNPAGGWMIVFLLLSLVLASLTGLVAYGTEEHAGPLLTFASTLPHWLAKAFEELHEFFANFTLLLVFIHLAGVILESFLHNENLVRAMWDGKKSVNE